MHVVVCRVWNLANIIFTTAPNSVFATGSICHNNGTAPSLTLGDLESPTYYNYTNDMSMTGRIRQNMSMTQPQPIKRRKHNSSTMSADDDIDSVGEDTENLNFYPGRSPASLSSQSGSWHSDLDTGDHGNHISFFLTKKGSEKDKNYVH